VLAAPNVSLSWQAFRTGIFELLSLAPTWISVMLSVQSFAKSSDGRTCGRQSPEVLNSWLILIGTDQLDRDDCFATGR